MIGHNDPCDTFTNLCQVRIKDVHRLITWYLNINSVSGKFGQREPLIEKYIDAWILEEIKINANFPNSQFMIHGYSPLFRYEKNKFGGGVLM